MNNRQKEVLQSQLNNEKKTLNDLKQIYKKALDDINNNIAALQGRTDTENLQSIIYQVDYQKALKKQVEGILDELNTKQFSSISEYLTNCYEDGFIGTMYDIQGQGVPLIFPIDQEQVVRALQTESKLSQSLYDSLGENTALLKKRISSNISRGFAQGQSYSDISKNIATGMVGNYSRMKGGALARAMLITRTEGHRIYQTSAMDAMTKAKNAGADIVKQWDSTLDSRTRIDHVYLDGQIKPIDEPFEIGGLKAQYPGGFGYPSEDCNCRCVSLTRARWALDEDELQTLKDRAEYFGLDKTTDFDDFKQKYIYISKNVSYNGIDSKSIRNSATKSNNSIDLDVNNFSDTFTATKSEKANTQKLVDCVNSLPNADQRTLELYNSIGKMDKFSANGIKFSISHGKNHAVTVSYNASSGKIVEVKLNVPKLSGDNLAGQVSTTLHEQMHLIDLMLRDDPTKHGKYFSASNQNLRGIVQKSSGTIGNDVLDLFKNFNAENNTLRATLQAEYDSAIDALRQQFLPNGIGGAGADYKAYRKAANKAWKDIMETRYDYESRNLMGGGISELQDIYDALSGGMYRNNGTVLYGHGLGYYSSSDRRIDEIIANYGALSVTRPDLIDMLRKDEPDLVSALEATIDEMRKKVATIV